MSDSENTNNTNVPTIKKSPNSTIITPLSGIADEQPNETLVTLGEQTPTEYSIKPAAEPDRSNTYHFVKHDNRSTEARQRDAEMRRESQIERIKEQLKSNLPGRQVIAEFDEDASGEQIASLVREAKSRLEAERAEAEEIRENRKADFLRSLQEKRAVCEYCHAVLGWDPYAEDRHHQTCSAYHEHKRAEEAHNLRRKNFKDRYSRLLDFDIPRSIGAVSDLVNTINELRFTESEAIYSDKDPAIKEGLRDIKEKISSESDYDRRRREQQISELRSAVSALEGLYRRLDEPAAEQSS